MKPFDLQAALRGEPVIDNDGNKYIQIVHLDKAHISRFRVKAVKEDGTIFGFNEKGESFWGTHHTLHMAPRIKKLWIAVKKQNEGEREYHFSSCAFSTKEELIKHMLTCFKEEEFVIKEIEIEV